MPAGMCKGCHRMTNSTVSNWWDRKKEGYVPTKCYVAWVNNKPVKGCAYDKVDPYEKDWVDSVLKGGGLTVFGGDKK